MKTKSLKKEDIIDQIFTNVIENRYIIRDKPNSSHVYIWQVGKESGSERGDWSVIDVIKNIKEGAWILEKKMEQHELVGKKFTTGAYDEIYTIYKVENDVAWVNWKSDTTGIDYRVDCVREYLKQKTWTLVEETPKVLTIADIDPTTVKYDFKGKNIRLDNEEEYNWVMTAANANGFRYSGGIHYNYSVVVSQLFFDKTISFASRNWNHTMGADYREITLSDILNSQTMKEQILYAFKVGDVVKLKREDGGIYTIKELDTEKTKSYQKACYKFVGASWDYEENLELVNLEIVGYELLKDLPTISAGTKSTPYMGKGRGGVTFSSVDSINITDRQLEDATWFKPIYKSKDIIVKISGDREVVLTKNNACITNVGDLNLSNIEGLYSAVNIRSSAGGHRVTMPEATIQVGCQSFTKEDIVTVYKALKDL